MTDEQESHSGNEVLIWRKRDEKRLNRGPHDTQYSFGGEGHIRRSLGINGLNLSTRVSACLLW